MKIMIKYYTKKPLEPKTKILNYNKGITKNKFTSYII